MFTVAWPAGHYPSHVSQEGTCLRDIQQEVLSADMLPDFCCEFYMTFIHFPMGMRVFSSLIIINVIKLFAVST